MFVQMSGAPGSGKSTIARPIAAAIGAVVVDHDLSKSALLEAGVPVDLAGPASYQVLRALAAELLAQGHNVIFDSPCLYSELLERGQRMAEEAGARYRYVECRVDDLDELDRRLRARTPMPSQLAGVRAPPTSGSGKSHIDDAVFRDWIAHMKRPAQGAFLLDTTRPLDVCIREALAYIAEE